MNVSVYDAVLPLPTCTKEEGCRSVITKKERPTGDPGVEMTHDSFELNGDFNISTMVRNVPR